MKFKCPKCGTLIEGQPERCPSCGAKFKWKKPEEAKPEPTKPASPAPVAKPRDDIALMMKVKPAMAKYRELYPEDEIDDEVVEKAIAENIERDTDEVLSKIHEFVLRCEKEKAAAAAATLKAEEEAKRNELKAKKKPYYTFGMVAAIVTLAFAMIAFMLGSAYVSMVASRGNFALVNFLFMGVILTSITMFILSLVRLIRCAKSMGVGDFDHFVERVENKKKPKLPVHLTFMVIDFSLLTALMIATFVYANSDASVRPGVAETIKELVLFLVFAVVPFVLGLVFYGQQRKRIQ